jgi:(E)-4-hydroxy-3-methylbut-2-enyl-diphosphate synthase
VSLTEDSVHEIPVARALAEMQWEGGRLPDAEWAWDPFVYRRRASGVVETQGVRVGGGELVRVAVSERSREQVKHKVSQMGDYQPEFVVEAAEVLEVDPRNTAAVESANALLTPRLVTVPDGLDLPVVPAFRLLASRIAERHPILLKDVLHRAATVSETDFLGTLLTASVNLGSLLCDGIGDAVWVRGEEAPGQALRLSYNILQAAGARVFKTDYVACPSCGRTLFDLQSTTARIKAATGHLKGVKIAIMGCIVNGPGEMADADFGYVGGAPGKVNLYVGKTPVKFNIPEAEAVQRLQDLIREHGRWVDPAVPAGM